MWVLTCERERFCCIHIIGKSIRMWLGLPGNTVAVLLNKGNISGPLRLPFYADLLAKPGWRALFYTNRRQAQSNRDLSDEEAQQAKRIGAPNRIRTYDTRFRNAARSSFQDHHW
jgi:hypothetical protein